MEVEATTVVALKWGVFAAMEVGGGGCCDGGSLRWGAQWRR